MLPLLTALTLTSFAPSPALALSPPHLPAPALVAPDPGSAYEEAIKQLESADTEVNMDPSGEGKAEALADALAATAEFAPQLSADDPARQRYVLEARLNLARAYMLRKDQEAAEAAMDAAIRQARGVDLPAREFGPQLDGLYKKRLSALSDAGRATLEVDCGVLCKVYIDDLELKGSGPQDLMLGTYRVWVQSTEGEREDLREEVTLDTEGQSVVLEFDAEKECPICPICKIQIEDPPKRVLPLGAEISMILGGIVVGSAGAVVMGIGSVENSIPMFAAGIATGAVGVGLLGAGVITLSIDERRLAKGGFDRRATLNFSYRF